MMTKEEARRHVRIVLIGYVAGHTIITNRDIEALSVLDAEGNWERRR